MANNHDPRTIFAHAIHWRIASHVLTGAAIHQSLPRIAVPGSICRAFSAELLLKCLATIETGQTPMGHKLRSLFDKISANNREKVKNHFDTHCDFEKLVYEHMGKEGVVHREPFGFDGALNASSEFYEKWRYLYEKNSAGTGWSGNAIAAAVEHVILELHPEWSELVPTSPTR